MHVDVERGNLLDSRDLQGTISEKWDTERGKQLAAIVSPLSELTLTVPRLCLLPNSQLVGMIGAPLKPNASEIPNNCMNRRPGLLDRNELYRWLDQAGQAAWRAEVAKICAERFSSQFHGDLKRWSAAWETLPVPDNTGWDASGSAVKVSGTPKIPSSELNKLLMEFHPWRKGPFEILDQFIDTEWRSDWKWDRLANSLNLSGCDVIDVGCGNGYYGWKMIDAGAHTVLGCDPTMLYIMQFEVLRKYWQGSALHTVLPIADHELGKKMECFDVALSMGVLYHRTAPIDHLLIMRDCLRKGGQLVLETLVVEDRELLVPKGRYAKMRNVWFIPSVELLSLWMERVGFVDIDVVDVSRTTTEEQRSTPWMTFESLSDFTQDEQTTIEGYPSPVRAMIVAKKK